MTTQPKPKDVANAFSRLLREKIGEEDLAEVVRRNKLYPTEIGICESHSFCDANMVMDAAMEELGSPWPDLDMDERERNLIVTDRTHVWNAAWNLAKGSDFKEIQ